MTTWDSELEKEYKALVAEQLLKIEDESFEDQKKYEATELEQMLA